MQTVRKIGDAVLFGGVIFLLFLFVFQHRLYIPAWLQVVGRMHPMFLHFPIVLLLLSFFAAWIPLKEKNNEWLLLLRLVAALSAIVTAIMGLLLSVTDDRSGNVLEWHKWAGVSTALLGSMFYYFQDFFTNKKIISKAYTVVASIVIILAGHFGADLTHGENYLLAPMSPEVKLVPVDEAIVFKDVIKPVLEKKCSGCHGEASMKGGLSLEDSTGILKGGKTGPLFIAGDPEKSLIIHRLLLPEDDKKHMPPISKPAMAKDEIALIRSWIKVGAVMNTRLISLPARDSFRILASRFLAPSDQPFDQPVYDFPAADKKKINTLNNNYRVIEQQGVNSPALSVHFYGKYAYSKKSLEELLPIKQQIIELSLAKMPVKDEELSIVKQMINLQKLNLNYTDITSKGLEELSALKKLTEISLSGADVTLHGLEKLLGLPQLTSVFIWNTKIDSAALASVRQRFKNIHIETGFIDKGDIIVALSPPLIKRPAGVFDDTAYIEIKHPFKGVELRYTLDGTAPDSVNSALYKQPISVNKTTALVARAYKKGWYGSSSARSFYIKKGLKPDSIELITEPNARYSTKGQTLSDKVLGDINVNAEEWVGYHGEDAAYYICFDTTVTVQNVLLNTLRITDAFIFPPTEVEVSGGTEKKKLKYLGKKKLKLAGKDQEPALLPEDLSFAATKVKYLKVIAKRLKVLPKWRKKKGEHPWVFVSEIVIN